MYIFICFYLSLDRTLHGKSANRTEGDSLWTTTANKIIGYCWITCEELGANEREILRPEKWYQMKLTCKLELFNFCLFAVQPFSWVFFRELL